jgi:excinuclease UvrABC nuclease subunit
MQQGPWTYINSYDRRFGPEFFKQVPEKPGVYWMQDSRRGLLFVGKALNLKSSLSSYRYILPQRSPKKLAQLMEDVRSLGWSPTDSPRSARLLEKQLLLRHQPVFNRSPSSEDNHAYVSFRSLYPYFQMELEEERPAGDAHLFVFGLFKNRAACQKALCSFTRLLWWISHDGRAAEHLPRPFIKSLGPAQKVEVQLDEKSFEILGELVRGYWEGESAEILEAFKDILTLRLKDPRQKFFRNWVEQDLNLLEHYFSLGPRKNKNIRSLFQLPAPHVQADWIDDVVLLS